MTTLVTGATGFLGATLIRRLVEEGVSVRGLRRKASTLDLLGDIADRVEWAEADVLDPESLERAFEDVSRVYHCAAYLGFEGKKSLDQLMAVNVQGTANVVDAALSSGVRRLVHTSSIAALGRSDGITECLNESAEWLPSASNSGYGKSKHLAELEVQRGIAEGLDAVIVNPSLIMGVGRAGENSTLLVEKIRQRRVPYIPSGGTNIVDVLDVVDGLLRAMERGKTGERYLLSGQNLSWMEIARIISDSFGVPPPRRTLSPGLMMGLAIITEFFGLITRSSPLITRETARLSSTISCYDNTRAKTELGCSFRPFTETASRIAEAL